MPLAVQKAVSIPDRDLGRLRLIPVPIPIPIPIVSIPDRDLGRLRPPAL